MTIRAEISGNTCSALGVTARGSAPILALCRKLIEAGHDPATPLDAYRGDTLCLKVRSIGEGARLRVSSDGTTFQRLAEALPEPPTGSPGTGTGAGVSKQAPG
jgi:hypothetical protein